jgi:hypothetical protein
VVLSDDLVRDPQGTLRALCAALDLPWQPEVSWALGLLPISVHMHVCCRGCLQQQRISDSTPLWCCLTVAAAVANVAPHHPALYRRC